MITAQNAKAITKLSQDMKRYGIRHNAFCARAGLTASTWVRWRDGVSNPNQKKLRAAREALDALIEDVRKGRLGAA